MVGLGTLEKPHNPQSFLQTDQTARQGERAGGQADGRADRRAGADGRAAKRAGGERGREGDPSESARARARNELKRSEQRARLRRHHCPTSWAHRPPCFLQRHEAAARLAGQPHIYRAHCSQVLLFFCTFSENAPCMLPAAEYRQLSVFFAKPHPMYSVPFQTIAV